MRIIFLIIALWVSFLSVSGQVAVPDTIYIYETVIVYDTIIIRDTVRIKKEVAMPSLKALDINLAPPTEKISSPPATFSENSIILHENYKNVKQKNVKTMKLNIASNLSAIILTAQTMSGLSAQETKPERDLKLFPFQASIVYPVSTMGAETVNYRYSFSLNLISGKVGALQGIEFGGLFNHAEQSVKGVQFAGLANKTAELTGIQFAGLHNASNTVKGAQFGGLTNVSADNTGVQFAGIVNITESILGAQFGGIANITEKSEGAQFAGITNISKEVSGASFSGIFNRTGTLRGCQFGLVNVIDTIESGVSIALVNIVKKGFYNEWSLSFADYLNIGLSYKLGIQKFYTILTAGATFWEEHLWASGIGFGNRTVLNQRFDFQPEVVFYQYHPLDFKNYQYASATHLKFGFVCKLNKRFGIVVAPSLYSFNAELTGSKRKISPIPPFFEYETNSSKFEPDFKTHRHSFGAGISVGIIL